MIIMRILLYLTRKHWTIFKKKQTLKITKNIYPGCIELATSLSLLLYFPVSDDNDDDDDDCSDDDDDGDQDEDKT